MGFASAATFGKSVALATPLGAAALFRVPPNWELVPPRPPITVLWRTETLLRVTELPLSMKMAPPSPAPPPLPEPPLVVKFCSVPPLIVSDAPFVTK